MKYLKKYESFSKMIQEAIVDVVSEQLSDIFTPEGKMKPEVRANIEKGMETIKKQFPDLKILDHFVVGAAVTYQFQDESDIDTTVVVDPATPKDKLKAVDKWIEANLDGKMTHGKRPYQFKVSYDGRDKTSNADAVYDAAKDTWIKKPDAEQAKKMFQAKITDKNSPENKTYTSMEKWVQPSLVAVYNAIPESKVYEEAETEAEPKGESAPKGEDAPKSEVAPKEGGKDLKSLITNAYKKYEENIKKLRGTAYSKETEKGYVSQNWGKGNVIYKMFDREGYNKVFAIMKDMVKSQKFDNPEQLKNLKAALVPVIKDEIGYNP